MDKKVVLAIDLGTTGNRVMAFARDGSIVARSYYEFPQIFPQPGWVEHDPGQILSTTLKALQEVCTKVGAENIDSIGITNQRETTILWDKNTGQPVYNAIVWQDRRTENTCLELAARRDLLKQKTGLFLDPYFSATKVKWIIDQVAGVKGRIAKGDILFGTPDTWVLWNLTARRAHLTEPSNASRTMLFNISLLNFDQELLQIFGVPENILPGIMPSDSLFGYLKKEICGREIPIHGVLGDQQASLFAQCAGQAGAVKATYGTGIFVMTNTGKQLRISETLINTVSWQIKKEVNYALEGSIFMGGAAIQWLRDNLKIIEKAADSEAIATALTDNEGVYFVPALQGLGAPYWEAQARGAITGLTRKSNRANIIRAALEAMAYQVCDVLNEMKKTSLEPLCQLRVDGGAAVNNFLMQFQADIARVPVERATITETTALGAAGVAAIATGFWDEQGFAGTIKRDRVFKPLLDEQKAQASYQGWQTAVNRCRQR